MANEDAIRLLREQKATIEELGRSQRAFGPTFDVWKTTTIRLLKQVGSRDHVRSFVATLSPSRIAQDEDDHYAMYLDCLENASEFLSAFLIEHDRMAGHPAAEFGPAPSLSAYRVHPQIERVSGSLFEKREFASAVFEACKCVIATVKLVGVSAGVVDEDGDSLMNKMFSAEHPRVRLNPLSNQSEIDEQRGFMFLFKGIVGVRNLKGHENVVLNDSNKAGEYLALCSLLLRRLDERHAPR